MSITGVSSSNLFSADPQSGPSAAQKLKQEFQQLGTDLQAGNLSAAQADFATLQKNGPQNNAQSNTENGSQNGSTASAQGSSSVATALQKLSTDLQAGSLSAAQADFSTLQQDVQGQTSQGGGRHGHHRHHGGGSENSDSTSTSSSSGSDSANPIGQLFAQLGQALQSGNLTAAQTAYSTLQKDFENFTQQGNGSASTTAGTTGVSVRA
jgi:hypothetical protein